METKTKSLVVTGKLTIYGAKDVFSYIDPAFKNLKITDEINNSEYVNVYELVDENANFLQVFLSLNKDPRLLGFPEETVVKYCLHNGDFLRKEKQNVFFYLGDKVVAKVNFHADGLHINRYDLHSPIVWQKNKKRFFAVVPSI